MSEPDITALARRLAEQNNVDWRGLSGSGEGGKIVERDVLDYLARVMAGEEAVNPTPEPLPDGMEAWPEQDIATVRQGVGEAATLGELRHEIGSAVREEPEPAPAAPGVPVDSLDDDVFLFDDEP
ncbi:MAG TPA: E3 binding domain-containing protein, partial [Trueperaceae bacterium]|nr:E3 binding domain-containing protein [Trueperaceae bacterium]